MVEHRGQILAVMIACLSMIILWGLCRGRKIKSESEPSGKVGR
jgi:hypothetical protein